MEQIATQLGVTKSAISKDLRELFPMETTPPVSKRGRKEMAAPRVRATACRTGLN